MNKSCGNCVNCDKTTFEGKEKWYCENWDRGVGMPFGVEPPHDEACSNWSDDPKDRDKALNEMHEFTDNFWF